jgi:DNA-directed RNA polymerase III subunit RPC2
MKQSGFVIQNRVIIELDPKDNVSAAITSSTHERKSRCSIFFKNQTQKVLDNNDAIDLKVPLNVIYKQMYLKHNTLGEDIPLVIALKAMGLESDQEIIQLIGVEPDIVDLFSGSLEEPYNIGVYTQQQVLQQSS